MTDDDFRRIAIVGVGLIGGSIAFAVRRTFPDAIVVGVDTDDVVVAARQLGALTHTSTSLEGIRGADLVVLAAPVQANLRILSSLPDLVGPATLVTDTGSTKRAIVAEAAARRAAPDVRRRAPAGRRRSRRHRGIQGRSVRTPSLGADAHRPTTPRPIVDRLAGFIRALGATPSRWMPARTIDCWRSPVTCRS